MSRAAVPSGSGGEGCGREKAALTWCSSGSQGGKLRCLFPPPFSLPQGQPWHQVALAATSLVGEGAFFSALSPPLKLGRKCHISWGGEVPPPSDPSPKPRKRSDFHTAKKGHRWPSPRMAEFLPSHPQFTLLLPPTSSPSLSGFSPQLCCSPSLALKGGGRGSGLTRNQQQCLHFRFFPLADKY